VRQEMGDVVRLLGRHPQHVGEESGQFLTPVVHVVDHILDRRRGDARVVGGFVDASTPGQVEQDLRDGLFVGSKREQGVEVARRERVPAGSAPQAVAASMRAEVRAGREPLVGAGLVGTVGARLG